MWRSRRKDGKVTHMKPQRRTLLPSPCCWGELHGPDPNLDTGLGVAGRPPGSKG